MSAGDGVVGCDVSHRGGPPGFVQVSGQGTLRFADYIGNFTFTTLGNSPLLQSLMYFSPEKSSILIELEQISASFSILPCFTCNDPM